MYKNRKLLALLLAALLLLSGCGGKGAVRDRIGDVAEKAASSAPASSPGTLREAMEGAGQLFAVAYFGCHYSQDQELSVDPFAVMKGYAPELCKDLPFLLQIPADRVIGESGDLFCVIPLDEDAAVAVNRGYWDDENGQYIYDDMLYSSAAGEPILLFCNSEGWAPDTQVYISGPSGEISWCPETDMNGYVSLPQEPVLRDISPYAELLMAEQRELREWGWILPTRDQLIGTTWSWSRYLEDGTEHTCEMSIDNDFLCAFWYDGEEHEYYDAAWELTYEEGIAVLSIDFGEMAGILRYDLLYHEEYGELYVSVDVLQKDFPMGGEPMTRYMTKTSVPYPIDMVGTWQLGWTEVEGDINGAEPGSQIIEITTDYEGHYQLNYTNNEFPDRSFYYKDLAIVYEELYYGCENDQWHATVDHIGYGNMEYSLTLLPDGSLLLRNYWELEGFRNVAHGWYVRLDTYTGEDPYADALSQGWRAPELSELADTFWLSWLNCYALELMEDHDPANDGGWAMLYDMGAEGEYTLCHTGNWQYTDGQLRLTLDPVSGSGTFVDDSFPVLMLDGELRIERSSSGIGLPHFYADTLADVLTQPEG